MKPSSPIRVGHLTSERRWRGGEQQLAYLLQGLPAGVENLVFCREDSAFEAWCRSHGIDHLALPFRNSLDLRTAEAVRRHAQRAGLDLLHTHTGKAHGIAWLASLHGNGPPLIVHRRVDFPVRGALSRWKFNAKPVRRIICVSEAVRQVLAPALRQPERSVVLPSGIDLQRFDAPLPREAFFRRFGLPGDAQVIGTSAALADHKDLPTLIRTASRLLAETPARRFVIFGEGPERARLERMIAERGLGGHVQLAGFQEDIDQLLPNLDAFLITSKTEGLGTSILDAFAADVPVVATAAGGIPELVRHGETGLLAPVGDDATLAANLQYILEMTTLAERLRANARAYVNNFDYREMARKTAEIYRAVLGLEA